LNSLSAISAALRIAMPATPALPPADIGRIRPAFTWPVPIVLAATAGPGGGPPSGGGALEDSDGSELKKLELFEHAANSVPAVPSKPASKRRRDGVATGVWSGISTGNALLLTTVFATAFGIAD
jgi:hypothetical protein